MLCTDRDTPSREDAKYRDAVWELFQEETKYLTRQLQPLEQVRIYHIYVMIKSHIKGHINLIYALHLHFNVYRAMQHDVLLKGKAIKIPYT